MVLNKNNNNEQAEYHGIIISFKDKIYSKQGSHIFLLFETWTLVLFLHAAAQIEIFVLGNQTFPVRVRLLAMCRGELSTVIARLMSKSL